MSVTSFGSYEGHSSHEYGRDPANPAAAGAGGLPSELADKRVTDWRLALDELGRPIPPPPGHHPQVPDGPVAGPLPDRRSRSGSWEDVAAPPLPPTTLLPVTPAPAVRPVPAARTFSAAPSEPFDVTGFDVSRFDVTQFDAAGFDVAAGRAGQPAALPNGAPTGRAPIPGAPTPGAPTPGAPTDSLPGLAPPSVSLPSGAFVPASVPVPTADLGMGLTALDDGLIDVEARPTAFAPHRSGQSPAAPDRWDVVVGGDLGTSRPGAVAGPPAPAVPGPGVPGQDGHGVSGSGVSGPGVPGQSRPADPGGVLDPVAGVGSAGVPAQAARLGPTKVALPPVLADLAAAAAAAVQAVGADAQADGAVRVDGVTVGAVTGPAPLEPYQGGGRVGPADLAARRAVVREQVDYALAEIALAKAAFRRACDDTGRSGWPFRDSELGLLRRPAVAHALARELAGVERLRVWAQELYWLQEQNRLY